jgi:hypothetical protein
LLRAAPLVSIEPEQTDLHGTTPFYRTYVLSSVPPPAMVVKGLRRLWASCDAPETRPGSSRWLAQLVLEEDDQGGEGGQANTD